MICLVPNIGSTSFKYRVLDIAQDVKILAQGRVERIGQPGGECADYPAAIRKCIADISGPGQPLEKPCRDGSCRLQGGSRRTSHSIPDHRRRISRGHGRILVSCSGSQSSLHCRDQGVSRRTSRRAAGGGHGDSSLRPDERGVDNLRGSVRVARKESASGAMDFTVPAIARRMNGLRS